MNLDKIYTAEKVAETLELSTRTVYQLAREGTLKGNKRSGRWYFLHSDLVRWIKGE